MPVSSAPGQAERVLDLLARLSGHASMPFERLLGVAVADDPARDDGPRADGTRPADCIVALRRLERTGAQVVVVAAGPQVQRRDAARARQAGFAARRAVLDGPWRIGRAAGDRPMSTEPGRRGPAARAMGAVFPYVPLALALIAEAAWIAVIAGLLDAFTLHEPVTGVPELLLAAVAGVVAARVLGPRLGDRWSRAAVGLAALAGLIGWLTSPNLVGSPGGWLAGVAFVRGMAHARPPVDPQRIGTLLAVGVPGLAIAAILGGMVTEPWRGDFLDAAQAQVLLFLVTGVSALALARLGEAGAGARIDARRNPAWLMLLGGLVLATMALAIWVGATAGSTIATIAGVLVVPLLVVGFVAGFDRRTLRILLISVVVMGVLGFIIRPLTGRRDGIRRGHGPTGRPARPGRPAGADRPRARPARRRADRVRPGRDAPRGPVAAAQGRRPRSTRTRSA